MAAGHDKPDDQQTLIGERLDTVPKGTSVYDALGRPVGTFTDLDAHRIRIDGRPEGLDFVSVPISAVREVHADEIHLTVRLDELQGQEAATSVGQEAGGRSWAVADAAPIAPSGPDAPPASHQRRPTGDEIDGSSFTATGTPIGLGSNTPVGDEPDTYQRWNRQIEAERGWATWTWLVAPIGLGAAGLAAWYVWRRRTRRTRLERLSDLLEAAAESMDPVLESARSRRLAWLAPLAVAPLAAAPLLLSRQRQAARTSWLPDSTPELRLSATPWKDWLSSPDRSDLRLVRDWLSSVDVPDARNAADRLSSLAKHRWDQTSSATLWWIGAPALAAAGLAAWLVARRSDREGRASTLGAVMSPRPQVIRPDATIFDAATMMRRLDVGALPVCDGRRLRGMVTDRDIVIRAIADGRDPHLTSVEDAMSKELVYAFEDDSVDRGASLMREHRIRRLPIVDRDKNLVGIVSLGDLAVDTSDDRLSGATLERISEPSRPRR